MMFIKLMVTGLIIGIIIQTSVLAQEKVQVVVKTVKKELTLKEEEKLLVEAKKSKIFIKGWDKPTVFIEIKLISKHPRKEVAAKEIEYIKYTIAQEKTNYVVKNFFHSSDNYSSVKSNLSAEFTIYIPDRLNIEVNNSYGSITINDVTGDARLTGKFCPMSVTNFKGNLSITTNYSDLELNKIDGELEIISNKSNSTIFQSQGSCSISSEYGETMLFLDNILNGINITGNKSTIHIFIKEFDQYSYMLSTTHADIQLPTTSLLANVKKEGNAVRFEKFETGKPQVKVTTTFNSINIRYK